MSRKNEGNGGAHRIHVINPYILMSTTQFKLGREIPQTFHLRHRVINFFILCHFFHQVSLAVFLVVTIQNNPPNAQIMRTARKMELSKMIEGYVRVWFACTKYVLFPNFDFIFNQFSDTF